MKSVGRLAFAYRTATSREDKSYVIYGLLWLTSWGSRNLVQWVERRGPWNFPIFDRFWELKQISCLFSIILLQCSYLFSVLSSILICRNISSTRLDNWGRILSLEYTWKSPLLISQILLLYWMKMWAILESLSTPQLINSVGKDLLSASSVKLLD